MKKADGMAWLAGALALLLGVAIYGLDRSGPAGPQAFGAAGGWLPSLLHTLAFALFSAALLPAGAVAEGFACAGWITLGLLFEAGQHPAWSAGLASALGGPLGAYFALGRLDPLDAGATVAGGLFAAGVLRGLRPWRRCSAHVRWQPVILLAGLASLVGSGGGVGWFPPCEGPYCDDDPPPPLAIAQIEPARQIVAAGAPARFTAIVTGLSGPVSYRWRRSIDGGLTFTDVPGGTAAMLVLPAVPLADDGLRLAVEVTQAGGPSAVATARLLVNASPGGVFEDTEFAEADWSAEPYTPPGGTPAVHDEAQATTGGNPGAWRRMHVTVPAGQGSVAVDHLSAQAVHDPATDGAIRVIDYAEQCVASSPSEAALLVEQGGRRYSGWPSAPCASTVWGEPIRQLALGPDDLTLLGGEPCPAGRACPDFSAAGAPLRFGYRRLLPAQPGATAEQGIDNWRVTVWRR